MKASLDATELPNETLQLNIDKSRGGRIAALLYSLVVVISAYEGVATISDRCLIVMCMSTCRGLVLQVCPMSFA